MLLLCFGTPKRQKESPIDFTWLSNTELHLFDQIDSGTGECLGTFGFLLTELDVIINNKVVFELSVNLN